MSGNHFSQIMMIIYLLRHGESERGPDDTNRALTAKGSDQIRGITKLAKSLGASVELILSSPLLRARQSAEIARQELNPGAEFKIDDCLEPESEPDEIFSFISSVAANDSAILLVSHMPLLKEFVSDLIGSAVELEIKPGTLARVDSQVPVTLGSGALSWLLPQFPS